jgi:hypothetical protein
VKHERHQTFTGSQGIIRIMPVLDSKATGEVVGGYKGQDHGFHEINTEVFEAFAGDGCSPCFPERWEGFQKIGNRDPSSLAQRKICSPSESGADGPLNLFRQEAESLLKGFDGNDKKRIYNHMKLLCINRLRLVYKHDGYIIFNGIHELA